MKTRVILFLTLLLPLFGACTKRDRIKQEAVKVENELREELRSIRIERGVAPFLDGMSYVEDFVLTIDPQPIARPYFFKIKEYKMVTGGDPEQVPTLKICDIIDQRFNSKVKALESVRQLEGEIGVSFGGSVTVSGKSTAEPFVEAIYTLRKLLAIQNTRVLVAIRGYADGQHGPWSEPLEGFPFNYETIRVLPPVDESSQNPLTYDSRERVIQIREGRYDNSLLPDLRAEFVRRELIIPSLRKCMQYRTDVMILKGFEYPDPDQPELRKVQVFVYLFEED